MGLLDDNYKTLEHDTFVALTVPISADEVKTLRIPKSALCSTSNYFVQALTGDFMESHHNSIHLHGDDPAAVKVFVHWVLNKSLPDFYQECGAASNSQELMATIKIRTWFLGDKYDIPKLQDAIKDTLVTTVIPVSVVQEIYDTTGEGHILRKLAIANVVYNYVHGMYSNEMLELYTYPDFFPDFSTALLAGMKLVGMSSSYKLLPTKSAYDVGK